ncbi:hypothetical protein ACFYM5_24910 [Streptomyces sp. NPDC006706]|uniref:hypothetical protein n=1 Tax=Streptomyces sp. NPDC006706 TaxID=3364761 RepID=UPI0036875140
MWPGEQPPGGGKTPQQPFPGGQSNPYQQPGYHQPSPYQQQPQPWNAPTLPSGTAAPRPPGGGGRNRTKLIAVMTAGVIVIAAGVTGYVLLGGGKDDRAAPGPSPQVSSADPRGADSDAATVKGWKVVVNPAAGIKFDVPPEWALQSTDWVTYVSDENDPDDEPLAAVRAPAFLKERWCSSDDDKDGTLEHTPLAVAGSRGNNSAKSTEEIASTDPKSWVYGQYTQPDRTRVRSGTVEPFTTDSGLEGSLGTAWSTGVEKSKKCTTDGKAWTFAFKNAQGDLASWSFSGAKGVSDEVPDATIRRIAATIRTYQAP